MNYNACVHSAKLNIIILTIVHCNSCLSSLFHANPQEHMASYTGMSLAKYFHLPG